MRLILQEELKLRTFGLQAEGYTVCANEKHMKKKAKNEALRRHFNKLYKQNKPFRWFLFIFSFLLFIWICIHTFTVA